MSTQEHKTFWPLMKDCITAEDKTAMIEFIQNAGRFTNGPMVKKFEQEWSKWLGCKHSLFVSSGSTANLLLVAAIKEKYNLKEGDKVIVPAITWVTNISPVIQLGLQPIFCDVDNSNFSGGQILLENGSNLLLEDGNAIDMDQGINPFGTPDPTATFDEQIFIIFRCSLSSHTMTTFHFHQII